MFDRRGRGAGSREQGEMREQGKQGRQGHKR